VTSVAILGPGGVGGVLAVRLALAGHHVVCIARAQTVAAIARDGLTVECDGETLHAQPEAATRLDESVDLLLITVKAFDLAPALACVDRSAVARGVALPLLNGLEHMAQIGALFGPRAVAGSIGRIEAYRRDPVTIVQLSARPLVRLGSDDLPRKMLSVVARLLEQVGVETHVERAEKDVLWEKAVRLAPLAAVSCASARPLGDIRSDPVWRDRLWGAVEEACAVAAADGVPLSAAAQRELIESMPATLTTSAARDLSAGRPTELDAIVGAVCRAGQALGVSTPVLDDLLRSLERR
jgi:2-dehydropantoate 2-reductase